MTNDRNKNVPLVEQFIGYASLECTKLAENSLLCALFFFFFFTGSTICHATSEIIALSYVIPPAVIALV